MNFREAIEMKSREFNELCQKHDVKTLYAFGSSVNNTFSEETSDIDLLVDVDTSDAIKRGENLLNLWDKFEIFFNRKVDLMTQASIRNPVLKESVNESKTLIYERKKQKISL